MRKLFLKFSILLFVLGMSINSAWADLGSMTLTSEQVAQLTNPVYKAQLTGYTSSTGGGKVYIVLEEGDPRCDIDDDPCWWEEGVSNVALFGLGITSIESAPMSMGNFRCWAQKDPGYYFTGWSLSNMGTDLWNNADDPYTYIVPTSMEENGTEYYTIYATFEPIRIADYAISGVNTTSKPASERYCEQTVVFSLSGDHISDADFKTPTVTGTPGTWSVTSWDYGTTNSEQVTVNVKFVAPDDNVAEYSANLVLETQAGIKMNVPLAARTVVAGVEALLFSKDNKTTPINQGALTAMITAANSTDVVKLNGDYASAVTIGKSLTLDLNGYTLSNKLTVTGGNVVLAYSKYGGTINGTTGTAIDLQGGTLTLNGDSIKASAIGVNIAAGAKLIQNGATIEAASAILNNGTLETTGGVAIGSGQCAVGASNGSITRINGGSFFLDNGSAAAVQISGSTARAYIKKGTIASEGAPYSAYGVSATNGASVEIEKLAVVNGTSYALYTNGGTILVKGGKFLTTYNFHYSETGSDSDVTLNTAYFKLKEDEQVEIKGKHLWRNTSGAEYRDGYEYLAGEFDDAIAAGVSVCHIGATSYQALEDALAYANNTSENVTIVLDNDYVLPAGNYTLPATATLLIPRTDDAPSLETIVNKEKDYATPSKFRKLTLSDGVNWNVYGTIEVSGSQYSCGDANTGAPTGPFGQLQMNEGSRITLLNGSVLRAWGYVTGDIANKDAENNVPSGEIDARKGAMVYELFEMGDWGSATIAGAGLINNDSIFPITNYFIQNIEAPVKYHPGAKLTTTTSVTELGQITMSANDIQVIGVSRTVNPDTAMFLMDEMADAENTWVRKWYDASKDQQVYEINSGAHVGQLVIPLVSGAILSSVPDFKIGSTKIEDLLYKMAGIPKGTPFPTELVLNSGHYFLPITSNFKLHVLTGQLDFTQSTELLPGSELEIDKEATVLITNVNNAEIQSGSLYIYDYRDWDTFAGDSYAKQVTYSPVFDGQPMIRDISSAEGVGSAIINVHGTFNTEYGYVFTTEHGGNIFSSVEDAGTFKFTIAAKPEGYSEDIVQLKNKTIRTTVHCYPAFLKNSAEYVANGGAEYAQTAGTEAETSYCYVDVDGTGGRWTLLEQEDCLVHDALNDIYFAKPQEYVAVSSNSEDPTTHTYSDAAGTGRLFILMTDADGNCQWWEVEEKDNYYHCIHPENDTYYEWDDVHSDWKEVRFTITWNNWDGTPVLDENNIAVEYEVPYGTQAEWLSTDPTRAKTVDYTYDFVGWSPELGIVTSDVTYTAVYEEKQIKYTVVFVQDGGVEIERHLLARDEVPECENIPTRTGYILQWEPSLGPVTGDQTYVATWLPEPPETYTITFKNYNGNVLKKEDGTTDAIYTVVADAKPAYDGATPAKPATSEYTYTFTGWKGPKGFTANNETLPAATENATYVAQFSETPREYTISYYKEDGKTLISTQSLVQGATPTPPAVEKENPVAGHTYTLVWKTLDGSSTIQTVTGNASYKPTYQDALNKYTVTLTSNLPGACVFSGAGIYEYNASATAITISLTANDGYTFTGWSDGQGGTSTSRQMAITGDINLEANFTFASNLEIGVGESETLTVPTEKDNLIITSDGVNSGQLIGAGNLTLTGEAIFRLAKSMDPETWYAIAVPWQVNPSTGVYAGSAHLTLGNDFYLIEFDASAYASAVREDRNYWNFLKAGDAMQPGTLYMIYLKSAQTALDFHKAAGAGLLTTSISVALASGSVPAQSNWNAIANPALYHANLSTGADADHVLRYTGNDTYVIDVTTNMIVGEPMFAQVSASSTVDAVPVGGSGMPAYHRAPAAQTIANNCFVVELTRDGKLADRMIVQTAEEKANEYVIGKDLAKMNISVKSAQMWIERYGANLCKNTVALNGEQVDYPLSFSAPMAGEYNLSAMLEQGEAILYLTYNGKPIWNLSYGEFVLNLEKGTTEGYGLRLCAKKVPTDIDAAVVDGKENPATKALIDNHVFIIRGNNVYGVDGRLVK